MNFTTRPELIGTFGAVTSTHWLGSAVGMSILENGGNAFDASVATGFTLQIVEPHLNGPGGDLPAVFYSAREDKVRVLCAQGPAPSAATIDHFQNLDLDTVPGSGLLPAVIPGAFCGWMQLLKDFGTKRLRDVLEPAIYYAHTGYPIVPNIANTIGKVAKLFQTEWTTSGEIYLTNGRVPEVGALHRNEKLAATYRRLVDEAEKIASDREGQIEAAVKLWQQGWVATAIDEFCRANEILDPSGRRHRGLLTGEDMANWSPTYEDPCSVPFGDYEVFKCGFWSQGPVMLQQLSILQNYDFSDLSALDPEFVHVTVEAAKLAFADREAWYGDPEFFDVPAATLLSGDYGKDRAQLIGSRASLEFLPGSPDSREPNVHAALTTSGEPGPNAELMGIGEPTVQSSGVSKGDTVHIDIIDREGNVVSCTPSGGWLQSSPVIPELGFCLGNRGQMFWLDEHSSSSLVPGKRPRTTLSPSLAFKNGRPYMAFGTPGGDQQDQWATIFFLRHVLFQHNLQETIDLPSYHSEHFPSSFWPRGRTPGKLVLEGRFDEQVANTLRNKGHVIHVGDLWSEGRMTAASRHGDLIKAAANPRGMQGYAIAR